VIPQLSAVRQVSAPYICGFNRRLTVTTHINPQKPIYIHVAAVKRLLNPHIYGADTCLTAEQLGYHIFGSTILDARAARLVAFVPTVLRWKVVSR
jgi:hypothetical protein